MKTLLVSVIVIMGAVGFVAGHEAYHWSTILLLAVLGVIVLETSYAVGVMHGFMGE